VATMSMLVMRMAFVRLRISFWLGLMRGTFVDIELDAAHMLTGFAFKMHVKIANIELRQFPFKRRRLDAEIGESPHGHIAADARKTIKK